MQKQAIRSGERRSNIERHFQSALSVILLGLVSWVGSSVLDTKERVIRLEERTAELRTQVREAVEDKFRGRDDFKKLEARVEVLERKDSRR